MQRSLLKHFENFLAPKLNILNMQFHTLKPKTKRYHSQQVGRGGTRGKTSGKGTKGQNARAGRKKRPEIRDTIKHFPKLRGRGRNSNKSIYRKAVAVNLKTLSGFSSGETVSPRTLLEKGIVTRVSGKLPEVKILSVGGSVAKLTFENVSFSVNARKAIESAGGVIK